MSEATCMNYEFDNKCAVCGDVAIGFNFSGLTCASCKAFFRRNAVRQKDFICPFDGNCEIRRDNRKFCKTCRLAKCIATGMRRELVNHRCARRSNLSGFFKVTNQHQWMILKQFEWDNIHEIQQAMSVFGHNGNVEIIRKAKDIIEALNLPEIYIRKVIRFCKAFHPFKCLKEDNQLIVLKAFFTEVWLVMSAFKCDFTNDGYELIENESGTHAIFVPFDIFHEYPHANIVPLLKKIMSSLHKQMENDSIIRDLIIIKFLFKSRDNIDCVEFIKFYNQRYSDLLRRYLEHKYKNVYNTERKYSLMKQLLTEMDYVCDVIRNMYAKQDSRQFTQLIVEIYNL